MKQIEVDNVVQHRDGGLYSILYRGTSTVDQSEHIVYVHLFPFDQKIWIRPLDEWTEDRFKALTQEEAEALLAKDREAFKAEITANKAARKNS